MLSTEYIENQLYVLYPDMGSGGGLDTSTEPDTQDRSLKDLVFESLHGIYNEQGAAAKFENILARTELLDELEKKGVLPPKEPSPNPYDLHTESLQFNQWLAQHDEEYKAYKSRLEERDKTLRHLYAGAILGRSFGDQIFAPPPRKHRGLIVSTPPIHKG